MLFKIAACLTASRAETSKKIFFTKVGAKMIFSILMLSRDHSNLLLDRIFPWFSFKSKIAFFSIWNHPNDIALLYKLLASQYIRYNYSLFGWTSAMYSGIKLTYRDLGGTILFSIFTMRIISPSQKTAIPNYNKVSYF